MNKPVDAEKWSFQNTSNRHENITTKTDKWDKTATVIQ
jgi:hypothetical protein